MPYSLHEKSGLVSLPIPAKDILNFDKNRAKPEHIVFDTPFLDRSHALAEETLPLLQESLSKELSDLGHIHADISEKIVAKKEIQLPEVAIGEEFFPPCMQYISAPMEDGKKRALFVLMNFLRVSGWSVEAVTEYVTKWNDAHPEPLREQYIKGQLAQIKKGKKPMPPPNCSNKDYYVSLGFCKPDCFCKRINNPAMYAKRKQDMQANKKPKKKATRTTKKKQLKKAQKEEKSSK
jgi:DNA primase large subunit